MTTDPSLPMRPRIAVDGPEQVDQLAPLFHRLNNQLGVGLAHAELLEAKSADDSYRVRAGQVVRAVLEAMSTAKEIRSRLSVAP